MNNYDYLVVGAGLFGATFAYEAAKRGKRVKVLIFSILLIRQSGNTLISLRNSTATRILQ